MRGFLFDMDGTTIDSNQIVEQAWARFCEPRGIVLEQLLEFSHGRLMEATLSRFMPDATDEERSAVGAELAAWEKEANDGVSEIVGAGALLATLDRLGAPWALVTSAPKHLAVTRFENVGLSLPAVAVTAERVTNGKPDPEGYLLAASELGVPIEQCLVFEDAGPGVQAGRSAGAQVVVVGDDASAPTAGLARISDLSAVNVIPGTCKGCFRVEV